MVAHVLANSSVLISNGEVVTINRPEIAHPHFLKQNWRAVTAAAVRFNGRLVVGFNPTPVSAPLKTAFGAMSQLERKFAFGQAADEIFKIAREFVVARVGDELVEIGGDGANVFGNAPLCCR